KIQREALKKEKDAESKQRLKDLEGEIDVLEREFSDLEEVWKSEKAALTGATRIKEEIEQARLELEAAHRQQDFAKMSEIQYGRMPELEKQLQAAQEAEHKGFTLLQDKVTAEEIAEVVSRWTGIPVAKMLEGEREKLLAMEDALHGRVIGQDEAVKSVSDAIRRSRAGTEDEAAMYTQMRAAVMAAVQQHFRPEFINRLDDIVVFHPLGQQHIQRIARIQTGYLGKRLAERQIRLEITDAALALLGEA